MRLGIIICPLRIGKICHDYYLYNLFSIPFLRAKKIKLFSSPHHLLFYNASYKRNILLVSTHIRRAFAKYQRLPTSQKISWRGFKEDFRCLKVTQCQWHHQYLFHNIDSLDITYYKINKNLTARNINNFNYWSILYRHGI